MADQDKPAAATAPAKPEGVTTKPGSTADKGPKQTSAGERS